MNKTIGKPEIETQKRVIRLFKDDLNYDYLGNWTEGLRTQSVRLSLMENSKHKMKFASCHFPSPDSGEVPSEATESHDGSFSLTLQDFHEQYMNISTRRLPHGE